MGLFIPQLQDPSQELHPLPEELFCLLQTGDGGALLVDNAGRDLVQNTPISDYELGAGDLFKAPEAILEEQVTEHDPVKAAISMMSNDDAITAEAMKVTDIDPIDGEVLLSEVLRDCNDPLAISAAEDTYYEPSDVKIPALQTEERKKKNDEVVRDGPTQRSFSSSCLTSVDWTQEGSARPNFLDLQRMDLGSLFGIKRTYSEGDIQVLRDCNDPLASSAAEDTYYEPSDAKILALQIQERKKKNDEVVRDGPTQRSFSSSCPTSVDWTQEGSARPNFLDLQRMYLGSLFGIRRTYSEGDIQVLGNGNMSHVNPIIVYPPLGDLLSTGDHKIEERRRKISRYRKKKTKRNFGRKIKYACRKALADSQPRVRGRFARVEECEASK